MTSKSGFAVPFIAHLLLRSAEELDQDVEAELEAYQRQYEDDHSWELLQEDEFGRLRPLVCDCSTGLMMGTLQPFCTAVVKSLPNAHNQ